MADNMEELGTSGLRRSSGFVIDEFLPTLQGAKGAKVYRDMGDNDPVIGSILLALEKTIQRLDWRVDPADETPQASDDADFIEGALDDMSSSFDATLGEVLTMLPYGWAYLEIVYKRRSGPEGSDPARRSKFTDGKVGWRKWSLRAQDTLMGWAFDDSGGVQGMKQMDPVGRKGVVFIPIDKALLFRVTTTKGNPEGRSLLRNAYRPWFFKRRIEEIEATGIERDLAGLPVAWVPPALLSGSATPEEQMVLAAIKELVTSIKRNEQEGVVFPSQFDENGHKVYDLTLLTTGGTRQFDTDKVITRYDQRIAMSVLSDFILLGHERVGSFSLGNSKMDLWSMAVDAIAKSIAEVVNTHAIPRLMRLNGMNVENPPTLTYGDVSTVDLAELGEFVKNLNAASLLTPDEPLEEYFRELAGMPPIDHTTSAPPPPPMVAPPPMIAPPAPGQPAPGQPPATDPAAPPVP